MCHRLRTYAPGHGRFRLGTTDDWRGGHDASAGILAPYIEAHEGGPLFDLTCTWTGDIRRIRRGGCGCHVRSFEFRRNGTIEVAEDDVRAHELKSRSRSPV